MSRERMEISIDSAMKLADRSERPGLRLKMKDMKDYYRELKWQGESLGPVYLQISQITGNKSPLKIKVRRSYPTNNR